MRTPGKAKLRDVVYGLYERRVARSLSPDRMPRHIGVIIDGNRRWARASGDPVSRGHEAGATKITEFLHWCDEVGVKVVTAQQHHAQRGVGAGDQQEDVAVVEPAQYGLAGRAPVEAVVQRGDAE